MPNDCVREPVSCAEPRRFPYICLCCGLQTGYHHAISRGPQSLNKSLFDRRLPTPPMKIRKAVFPVAGLGTRVLPATKAMPKEMLTIVDKPLDQHVVDDGKEDGIEHFRFFTGRNKAVIVDHFDRMFELDTTLAARGKKAE